MRSTAEMSGKIERYSILMVVGFAFGVSALGIRIPFLYDDFVKLMYAQGHLVNPLSMFDPRAFPPFRPVVHLFYQINYRLFGITNYAGYHLSLALVHSLNALLIYLMGRILSGKRHLGFLAAALFAVFPSNLWSIWWISNVENVLTLTLFLASFYFFIRWTREGRGSLLALTFLLAFLSFLAKMAATLPFVLLAYLLIYKDEVTLKRRSLRIALSALFILDFLSYLVPRAIRTGVSLLRVDFPTMYFRLTGEYGSDVQGVGRHIPDNLLSYFSSLFLFDKFSHPQMPFRVFFLLGAMAILLLLLFLDLRGRTKRSRPIFYLVFALIVAAGSSFINKSLALNLVSLVFFVYWFVFGNRIERFSISWLFVIIVPYLFFRPAYFVASRYLYFPNVGLVFLLGSVGWRTVEQLAIRFRLRVSERLAKRALLVVIGLSFIFLTTIYGRDKYLDSLSLGTLEWKTHQFIYQNILPGEKVVTINQPGSLGFKKVQLENMGRPDIKFDYLNIENPMEFYLGDVYFLDYRSFRLDRPVDLNRYFRYQAEAEENLDAIRLQLKVYKNIRGVGFGRRDEEYYCLRPGKQLTGFLASQTSGKKRLVISCLNFLGGEDKIFPLLVKIGGQPLPLLRESGNEPGLTSFVSQPHLGGGANKIEVINRSQKSDILISRISLESAGEEKVAKPGFSETEHIRQMYEEVNPKLSFRARDEEEWRKWRGELRAKLRELLGEFPEKVPLNGITVKVEDKGDYIMEKVIYQSEPGVLVPAYLLIPKGVEFPRPAVVALHGRGVGKDEVVGIIDTIHTADYGLQLVRKGYVVIAPDARGFGERATGDREPKESLEALLLGRTMMGMKTWDVIRAVDYLLTRSEVDGEKIGSVGFSMGGALTLFAAALDDRIKVAVVSGFFNTYGSAFIGTDVGGPWMIVPGILKYAEMSDIAGLIAPRPLLIESGKLDAGFPVEGALAAFQQLERIYRLLGVEDKLVMDLFSGGHRFNGEKAYPWLERWLHP